MVSLPLQFITAIFLFSYIFSISTITLAATPTTEENVAMPSEEEMEGINSVIKQTDLMKALKEHADNHDKQLVAINEMVVQQLSNLHTRFEGIVSGMEKKEQLLIQHIDAVEKRLDQKLLESKEVADSGGSSSHFWPYTILFIGIVVISGIIFTKIEALKSEDNFYGSSARGRKRSM
jgi:hypothetical protein